MHRDEVIARLRALKPRLNAEGIARLYLFGSVLRDEAGPDSDVDLFFDHDLPNFGLFDYVGMKLKAAEPEIPWARIAGIGNVLRHDYDAIEGSLLLTSIATDLPPLEAALRRRLTRL